MVHMDFLSYLNLNLKKKKKKKKFFWLFAQFTDSLELDQEHSEYMLYVHIYYLWERWG